MPAANERAAAIIRARGKARPRNKQKLPPQQQPNLIRLEYFKAIGWVPEDAQEILLKMLIPALPEILPDDEDARADSVRFDAASAAKRKQQVDAIVKRAAAQMAESLKPKEIASIAAKFGARTSEFQREQLDKQVRAAFSVSLDKIAITEKGVVKQVEGWIALNTDLIVSLPDRYFDDIRSRVHEAIDFGTRHETMAKELASRYEIPINQAKLIARDQVGKLYGDLNSQRQQNLGVTGYTWRGVRDNREREDHVEREGVKFGWDDPPEDGHPGFPVNCRCYAEPDFSAILDAL